MEGEGKPEACNEFITQEAQCNAEAYDVAAAWSPPVTGKRAVRKCTQSEPARRPRCATRPQANVRNKKTNRRPPS